MEGKNKEGLRRLNMGDPIHSVNMINQDRVEPGKFNVIYADPP